MQGHRTPELIRSICNAWSSNGLKCKPDMHGRRGMTLSLYCVSCSQQAGCMFSLLGSDALLHNRKNEKCICDTSRQSPTGAVVCCRADDA